MVQYEQTIRKKKNLSVNLYFENRAGQRFIILATSLVRGVYGGEGGVNTTYRHLGNRLFKMQFSGSSKYLYIYRCLTYLHGKRLPACIIVYQRTSIYNGSVQCY